MAIAAVTGGTINNAVAGSTLTFVGFSSTVGDTIVVCVSILDTTKSVSSITDTALNSYTMIAAVNGSGIRSEIWAVASAAHNAANVILVTLSGSSLASAAYEEYSGVSSIGSSSTNSGSSFYPLGQTSTQDLSNFIVSCLSVASSSGDTNTAKVGTARQTIIPALTTAGTVLMDSSQPSKTTESLNYGQWSASRAWASASLELRTGGSLGSIPQANFVLDEPVVVKSILLATYVKNAIEPATTAGGAVTGAPVWGGWIFGSGTVGIVYSEEWDMPTSAPITYTLHSGSLPTGLSLTAGAGNVGILSGTPSVANSYTFTLRATNSYGTADKSFTIVISAAAASGGGSYTFVA